MAMNQMGLVNSWLPYSATHILQKASKNLLYKQDGLVLGICNGFQALIKLGLLPGGHIETLTADHLP